MAITSSLEMLIRAQYGVRTQQRINPVTDTVATSATRIVGANPNRVSLTIANIGPSTIYISPKNDVSSTKGLILPGGGTTISYRWDIDFEALADELWAVSDGVAGTVFVLENLIIGGF
jgi:hypothetical protein